MPCNVSCCEPAISMCEKWQAHTPLFDESYHDFFTLNVLKKCQCQDIQPVNHIINEADNVE